MLTLSSPLRSLLHLTNELCVIFIKHSVIRLLRADGIKCRCSKRMKSFLDVSVLFLFLKITALPSFCIYCRLNLISSLHKLNYEPLWTHTEFSVLAAVDLLLSFMLILHSTTFKLHIAFLYNQILQRAFPRIFYS